MKKYAKILSLALAVMLAVGLFAGCSQDGNTTSTAPSTEPTVSTEPNTSTEPSTEPTTSTEPTEEPTGGTLTMATEAGFPPYEYYEDNVIIGIDAEIAAAIANKLGMSLQIDDMEFDSTITAVQTGKADIAMAGMTVTEERMKSVNFSDSYATGIQVVVVAENGSVASLDDLAGKSIGVQQNTTGDIYATGDYGDENIQRFARYADAVSALSTGKIDAIIMDNEPAKSFVAANEGLKILDTEYAVEDYAIAIAKENTDLLDKVNAALKELTDDGTIPGIIAKYIPAE